MQPLKTEAGISHRIKLMAAKQELTANSKTDDRRSAGCIMRLWWFGDHWNCLQSPPHGLNDEEALAFLRNWSAD